MKEKFFMIADVLIAVGLLGAAMKGQISWEAALTGVALALKPTGLSGLFQKKQQ